MSTKAAIVAHLLADANVSALVSTRVFQMPADYNTERPYIAISQHGGIEALHATGDSGLVRDDGDIFCVDDDQESAFVLAATARAALPIRATVGTGGDTITAKRVGLGRPVDDQTAPTDAGARGRFAARVSWSIWHTVTKRDLN